MDYMAILEGQIKRLEKKSEEIEKKIQSPAEKHVWWQKQYLNW